MFQKIKQSVAFTSCHELAPVHTDCMGTERAGIRLGRQLDALMV